MKTTIALLSLLFLSFAAPAFGADGSSGKPPASAPELSPLARKYATKREALLKRYAQKRRTLVDSPEWKALGESARQKKLDALTAEAEAADRRLTGQYDARLERNREMKTAEQASADQTRQRQLDETQAQAAQEALRSKAAP